MEEWKNVIGYEGLYEVSDKGNVRNVRRNTLLKLSKNNYGYIQVYLYKKKKERRSGEKIIERSIMSGRENID